MKKKKGKGLRLLNPSSKSQKTKGNAQTKLKKKRKSITKDRKRNQQKQKNYSQKQKSSSKKQTKLSKNISKIKAPLINKIRSIVKNVSENLDAHYQVAKRRSYIESRLFFDGDPTLMANLVREVQTAKSLSPKGKRARFQITFIPDDDLKELKYFKRNKMTTSLISAKELMGRYIKMVDTARERDWNFAQMFIGIVIDEEEDGN